MAKRRRPRPKLYAPRRVPQSYPPAYVRVKLLPLLPAVISATALGFIAESSRTPDSWRDRARNKSIAIGEDTTQRSQRLFFDEPGLDTLFVRSLAGLVGLVSRSGRTLLKTRVALGRNTAQVERLRRLIPLIPTRNFDSLMTAMLTAGSAVGVMRGGPVHAQVIHDSDHDPTDLPAPEGHSPAQLRRPDPPASLADMCADIDDMYWSVTDGHTLKITRVGTGEARRWLMSLPGTSHMNPHSTVNPADMESNIREMIGLESASRVGAVKALHDAMTRDGVPEERWAHEPVLICGHSQGGLIAAVLASKPSTTSGVDVQAILATGAPTRRVRIRQDVTMVSVDHDQDVIPATDGTPARPPDHRVMAGRHLVRPRKDPLYYAHSSATYTETVRHLERKARVAPWGRTPTAVAALTDFLPQPGEDTRVLFYEIWQDLLEPTSADTVDTFVNLDRCEDFEPVEYASQWSPAPLIERSALAPKFFAGVGIGPKSRIVQPSHEGGEVCVLPVEDAPSAPENAPALDPHSDTDPRLADDDQEESPSGRTTDHD